MPARSSSLVAFRWIRWLASRVRPASPSSGPTSSGMPFSSVSTTMPEATSPARAPPMPSATANSGGRENALSSLERRSRPVSVSWTESATRRITGLGSLDVGELVVADGDAVAGVQRLRAAQGLAVEVRAVGRAEVLQDQQVALTHDPRMSGGREGVLDPDVDGVPAAQRETVDEVVLVAVV